MPMDFPDFDSIKRASDMHRFRKPFLGETEDSFRLALSDFVKPIDLIESFEIRFRHGWDKFTEEEKRQMVGA
jgi:hypothetical protein